jgi:hypothetical protein
MRWKSNEMTANKQDDIVQTDFTDEAEEPVVRLLAQTLDAAHTLQGIVIGYVRKDGAATVRYTPMSTAMLSHLHRIFGLKVDREYMASMFPQQVAPMRPPSAIESRQRERQRNRKKSHRGDPS